MICKRTRDDGCEPYDARTCRKAPKKEVSLIGIAFPDRSILISNRFSRYYINFLSKCTRNNLEKKIRIFLYTTMILNKFFHVIFFVLCTQSAYLRGNKRARITGLLSVKFWLLLLGDKLICWLTLLVTRGLLCVLRIFSYSMYRIHTL